MEEEEEEPAEDVSVSLSSGPSVEAGELGDRRVAHGAGRRDCARAREGDRMSVVWG